MMAYEYHPEIDEPLGMRELGARVPRLLRRVRTAKHQQMPEYDGGRVRVDPQRQASWRGGLHARLSPGMAGGLAFYRRIDQDVALQGAEERRK
jgi:DNA-binding response OmpR family regulator